MKIETQTIQHEGNLTFEDSVTMAIADDPRSMAIILRSLISAYKNPYRAALREYTSNANDSHREAGQTRAVEVTLPTALSPNLIVQDWGVGMSRAELVRYSQFGASNKRDSNDMIGGFGIGSKSGLAVASQFTVTAVKDGKRNVAVIGYNEDGVPTMGLLPEKDTTEPSGVKVTIPLTDASSFGNVAGSDSMFWLGWKPGSIKVNGRTEFTSVHNPDHYTPQAGLGWRPLGSASRNGADHFRALIGAVQYQIAWNDTGLANEVPVALRRNYLADMVIELENGSVDLTPSREELVFSKRTRAALKAKIESAVSAAKVVFQSEIDSAKKVGEVLRIMVKATRSGLPHEAFTYKGKSIPNFSNYNSGSSTDTRVNIEPNNIALLGYGNSRRRVPEQDAFSHLYGHGRDDSFNILVTDSDNQPSSHNYGDYHRESIQAAHYVDALWRKTGDTTPIGRAIVQITSRKAADLSKWDRSMYDHVVDAATFEAAGLAHRKVVQSESRTANANGVPRPKGVRVRKVTRWSGRGYKAGWDTMAIDTLDTTIPYVILRNVEQVHAAQVWSDLMRGGSNYSSSETATVIESGLNKTFGILLAASNWDTAKYADTLTITTPEEIIKGLAVASYQSKLTAIQQDALYDRSNADWRTNIKSAHLADVVNPDTRAWLDALNDGVLATANARTLLLSRVATYNMVTLPPAPNAPQVTGRAKRYPLLKYMTYSRPSGESLVEYINLIDTIR